MSYDIIIKKLQPTSVSKLKTLLARHGYTSHTSLGIKYLYKNIGKDGGVTVEPQSTTEVWVRSPIWASKKS